MLDRLSFSSLPAARSWSSVAGACPCRDEAIIQRGPDPASLLLAYNTIWWINGFCKLSCTHAHSLQVTGTLGPSSKLTIASQMHMPILDEYILLLCFAHQYMPHHFVQYIHFLSPRGPLKNLFLCPDRFNGNTLLDFKTHSPHQVFS